MLALVWRRLYPDMAEAVLVRLFRPEDNWPQALLDGYFSARNDSADAGFAVAACPGPTEGDGRLEVGAEAVRFSSW